MSPRVALVLAGVATLGYGGWLLVRAARTPGQLVALGAWFLAGPPLHHLLVAPLVASIGLLLARALPRPWRTTVAVGAAASGVLLLVALPVLGGPAEVPETGPADRHHLAGLLVFLAVLWGLLLGATLHRIARDQRRGRW